jgi:hypothetical protein
MHSDSAFTIGDSHLICEDYAMNLQVEGNHHIAVCDGCSSSEMTDIGARLLALTALAVLSYQQDFDNISFIIDKIAWQINMNIRSMHIFEPLPNTMFDATLLVARKIGDSIGVLTVGDGYIVAKTKTGSLEIIKLEYPSGYPQYLSYKLNAEREKAFKKESPYLVQSELFLVNGKEPSFFGKLNIEGDFTWHRFHTAKYDWIALMSDGVNSFRDKLKHDIDPIRVIEYITDFKTTAGEFVKRRLNRFRQECRKNEWTHYDDVSIAVIHTGE